MDMYFNHWTSATQPGPLFFGGGCSLDTGLPGDMSRAYHTVQVRREKCGGKGQGVEEGKGEEGEGRGGRGGEGRGEEKRGVCTRSRVE